MSPEERRLLEETAGLSRENHNILRKLLRNQRWGQFVGFIKWVFIIGSTIGLYYYFQPYLDQLVQFIRTNLPNFPNGALNSFFPPR